MATTKANTEIVMVMMESGALVISHFYSTVVGTYIFTTPALVASERSQQGPLGFMFSPWLPYEILRDTEIEIEKRQVIGRVHASPELVAFYETWSANEREKLVIFAEDFSKQVVAIQQYDTERSERLKDRKKLAVEASSQLANTLPHRPFLPDSIYEMFEHDKNWGDANTSH